MILRVSNLIVSTKICRPRKSVTHANVSSYNEKIKVTIFEDHAVKEVYIKYSVDRLAESLRLILKKNDRKVTAISYQMMQVI